MSRRKSRLTHATLPVQAPPFKPGGKEVIQVAQSMELNSQSLLDEFAMDADVAELAVVDDLWYFITKNGNWIVGSG